MMEMAALAQALRRFADGLRSGAEACGLGSYREDERDLLNLAEEADGLAIAAEQLAKEKGNARNG